MTSISDSTRFQHPETPFPVGVEYYRGPIPRPEVWDGDFARLSAAGFKIVRGFSFWNHMEPQPGRYELDDFDRFFDLAEKHGLSVWMDIALATRATDLLTAADVKGGGKVYRRGGAKLYHRMPQPECENLVVRVSQA